MKILLVHNLYRSGSPGGEDVVFRQEKNLLESAGHQVITYTRSNDEMDARNPLHVWRTLIGMRRSSRTVAELGALIRRELPDVAHFHNTFPLISSAGFEVCIAAGVPIVQTIHNYRFTCATGMHHRAAAVCEVCVPGRPWAAIRHRCYRNSAWASAAVAWTIHHQYRMPTARMVDRFIVLGEFAAQRLERSGVARTKIVIKPNFVPGHSAHEAALPVSLRHPPYALFAGRLSVEKGLRTILEAWRALPGIPLKIAGDGPLSHELRRRVQSESLNVEFLGMQTRERVIELAAGARLQIVASEWFEAGVPLVAWEAMASGTPVVAACIGGVRGDGMLAFHPGDASDLAQQVETLWRDDQLARQLAVVGRARYEALATPQRSLAVLEKTYRELIERRAAA